MERGRGADNDADDDDDFRRVRRPAAEGDENIASFAPPTKEVVIPLNKVRATAVEDGCSSALRLV